jgi:tRNA(Ile)-lysidine synthase
MPIFHKLQKKVITAVRQYQLVSPGDTILIGVSGGADSTALLHLFHELRHFWSIQIKVAHINHQWRKSSIRDEEFVKRHCATLNIRCYARKLVPPRATDRGSQEERARQQRLRQLLRIAKAGRCHKIALAHHQDDLAETVLMRFIRGAGLLGLQGFSPERTFEGIPVIRPLIHVSREDIEIYCRENNIRFLSDPSNQDTRFLRNRIRKELLPLLSKDYNPKIKEGLARLAGSLGTDYDYIHSMAQSRFSRTLRKKTACQIRLSLKDLSDTPPALQRHILRLAIEELQGHLRRLTFQHMLEMEDLIGNRPILSVVQLTRELSAIKEPEELVIRFQKSREKN